MTKTHADNTLHTIRYRPRTFYTGVMADGKQVLFGWHSDFVAVLIFDTMGNLLETREYPLGIDLKQGYGPVVEARALWEILTIKAALHFRGSSIHVKPFFVEKWQLGIKPFPLDLEDYLTHPQDFSDDDAADYRADIARWIAEGNCVLYWGEGYDHFLKRDGNTM